MLRPHPLVVADDSNRSDNAVLLVEAGGTYLRAALARSAGPGPRHRQLTPSLRTEGEQPDVALRRTLEALAALGRTACGAVAPARAVVAWPGPISPAGIVYASPTVSGQSAGPVAVADLLAAAWRGATVVLINDLTAAGLRLREAGMTDFAVITVGSGIGHKVFAGGQPLLGPSGRGGELGHLVVAEGPDAIDCDCGGRGHLGALASGRAIVRRVHARWAADRSAPARPGSLEDSVDPDAAGGRAVLAAMREGDSTATEVVSQAARLLGRALAGLHLGVGVERFVLVGGFARAAGEPYRTAVVAGASQSCWDLGLDWDAAITVDEADDEQGLVGVWLRARELGWV